MLDVCREAPNLGHQRLTSTADIAASEEIVVEYMADVPGFWLERRTNRRASLQERAGDFDACIERVIPETTSLPITIELI